MYTVEAIKAYARTCWIHLSSGDQVRGFFFLVGRTPCMCLLDSAGEYRWYANRIASSERTVRTMLAAHTQ